MSAVEEGSRGRSKGDRIPWLLVVGEVLLGLVICRYTVSFIIGTISDWDEALGTAMSVFSLIFNLVMIVLTVDSIIGLASAKPSSWRKAMRLSVILASISILYDVLEWLGIDHEFIAFQNVVIIPLAAATVLVMMLPSVRRFYIPPLAEMPPLRRWVGYILFWPLMPDGSYRFSRGGAAVQSEDSGNSSS